ADGAHAALPPFVGRYRSRDPADRHSSHPYWSDARAWPIFRPHWTSGSTIMRLRYRIAAGALLLVPAGLIVLLAAMCYDATCESTARVQTSAPSMKAAVRRCYGPPEVI